ncbi:MAG: hypothetical protein IIY21_13090 [Clostridiales bacterium]|nr:hypothetical protein [Clostridiales bacterium]
MDILNSVLSIVLTGVMGYVVWLLQNHKNSKDDTKMALVVLLRETIELRYSLYVDRESLTKEEYKDFEELYQVYHRLGGNGTGTRMYEEIKQKPVKG